MSATQHEHAQAPNWHPDLYDEGYYKRGERCGFKDYEFGHPGQQQQLAIKWKDCQTVEHNSVLFVGCSLGFEVAYWRARLRQSFGVDVSRWAIVNAHPTAKPFVSLYSGRDLAEIGATEDAFDLVASFDVLTHCPDSVLDTLIPAMCRSAKRGIVFRNIVKNYRNRDAKVDFLDGCFGRYLTFEEWDRRFTASGKFKLSEAHLTRDNYETTFTFLRA